MIYRRENGIEIDLNYRDYWLILLFSWFYLTHKKYQMLNLSSLSRYDSSNYFIIIIIIGFYSDEIELSTLFTGYKLIY